MIWATGDEFLLVSIHKHVGVKELCPCRLYCVGSLWKWKFSDRVQLLLLSVIKIQKHSIQICKVKLTYEGMKEITRFVLNFMDCRSWQSARIQDHQTVTSCKKWLVRNDEQADFKLNKQQYGNTTFLPQLFVNIYVSLFQENF